MTDLPIIFSAPMVRALLEGRKTQTRRILKTVPPAPAMDAVHPRNPVRHDAPYLDAYCGERKTPENPRGMGRNWCWWTRDDRPGVQFNVRYQPGDRLWVREGWKPHSLYADMKPREMPKANVFYLADDKYEPSNVRGVPSIHMPRWASRLTLLVTGVKVERLSDISLDDIAAEGCKPRKSEWALLWDSINGEGAYMLDPFVVAITFRVIKANIDAPEARAAA